MQAYLFKLLEQKNPNLKKDWLCFFLFEMAQEPTQFTAIHLGQAIKLIHAMLHGASISCDTLLRYLLNSKRPVTIWSAANFRLVQYGPQFQTFSGNLLQSTTPPLVELVSAVSCPFFFIKRTLKKTTAFPFLLPIPAHPNT